MDIDFDLEIDDQGVDLSDGQAEWPDGNLQSCQCYMHPVAQIFGALTSDRWLPEPITNLASDAIFSRNVVEKNNDQIGRRSQN